MGGPLDELRKRSPETVRECRANGDDLQYLSRLALAAKTPFSALELAQAYGQPGLAEDLHRELRRDERLIPLPGPSGHAGLLILKRAVIMWLLSLTYRLSRLGFFALSERDFRGSVRLWCDSPATGPLTEVIMRCGADSGLAPAGYEIGSYAFPLARLLRVLGPKRGLAVLVQVEDLTQCNLEAGDLLETRDALLSSMLEGIGGIYARVLRMRCGFAEEAARTLKEVAHELGLSRGRVHQIEQAALWKLNEFRWTPRSISGEGKSPARALTSSLAVAVVLDFLLRRCRTAIETAFQEDSARVFLLTLARKLVEHNLSSPLRPGDSLFLFGWSDETTMHLSKGLDVGDLLDIDLAVQRVQAMLGPGFSRDDLLAMASRSVRIKREGLRESERVLAALIRLGRPSHYKVITEVRKELFPECPTQDRNVHAILSRGTHGVVRTGSRGIYTLERWGCSKREAGPVSRPTRNKSTQV